MDASKARFNSDVTTRITPIMLEDILINSFRRMVFGIEYTLRLYNQVPIHGILPPHFVTSGLQPETVQRKAAVMTAVAAGGWWLVQLIGPLLPTSRQDCNNRQQEA